MQNEAENVDLMNDVVIRRILDETTPNSISASLPLPRTDFIPKVSRVH